MSVDYVVDVEEENVVEAHPYLTAGGRRSCALAYCYFASSANTLAFLATKRSSASRLRARAFLRSSTAPSRSVPFDVGGVDFAAGGRGGRGGKRSITRARPWGDRATK